jgi:hypothetical protein
MGTDDGFTHGMSLRFCDSHHIRDLFPQELKTEKAQLRLGFFRRRTRSCVPLLGEINLDSNCFEEQRLFTFIHF